MHLPTASVSHMPVSQKIVATAQTQARRTYENRGRRAWGCARRMGWALNLDQKPTSDCASATQADVARAFAHGSRSVETAHYQSPPTGRESLAPLKKRPVSTPSSALLLLPPISILPCGRLFSSPHQQPANLDLAEAHRCALR